MSEKDCAIMYLKAIVAILDQNRNFKGEFSIIEGYFDMAKISYDNYKMEVLENE